MRERREENIVSLVNGLLLFFFLGNSHTEGFRDRGSGKDRQAETEAGVNVKD